MAQSSLVTVILVTADVEVPIPTPTKAGYMHRGQREGVDG